MVPEADVEQKGASDPRARTRTSANSIVLTQHRKEYTTTRHPVVTKNVHTHPATPITRTNGATYHHHRKESSQLQAAKRVVITL